MLTFNMLVGLPGAGKTSYAKSIALNNTAIISSDDIREELFGDASIQENPAAVFEEMFKRTITHLINGNDVIYDATNLIRKKRLNTLNRIKDKMKKNGIEVKFICTICLCGYIDCIKRQEKRERKVPENVIMNMMKMFQVPYYELEPWDDIKVVFRGNSDFDYAQCLQGCVGALRMLEQTSEWHTESAYAHSQMCKVLTEEFCDDYDLIDISEFHDVGKSFTRTQDEKGNYHFYGHENVGAYIYLTAKVQNIIDFYEWDEDSKTYKEYADMYLYQAYLIDNHDIAWKRGKTFNAMSKETQDKLILFNKFDRMASITKEQYDSIFNLNS